MVVSLRAENISKLEVEQFNHHQQRKYESYAIDIQNFIQEVLYNLTYLVIIEIKLEKSLQRTKKNTNITTAAIRMENKQQT